MIRLLVAAIFFLGILQPKTAKAQSNFGFGFGLSTELGTTIQSLGIRVYLYQTTKQWQLSGSIASLYRFKNWAENSASYEFQISTGILYAYGKIQQPYTHSNDVLYNRTGYAYSVGYAHNLYLTNNKTSQRTGSIATSIERWRILHENDILGELGSDKFRTAAIALKYENKHAEYGLHAILWTGDFRDAGTKKITHDTTFNARYGYYDLSETHHGNQSHGILAIHVQKYLGYHHFGNSSIGIDAEQIRNTLQNKLLHDATIIPEYIMRYKNLHFPMIADDGTAYLYQTGQNIRKPSFFFQTGINNNLFY